MIFLFRPVSISSTYCNRTMLQRLHVLTLLMYWALSFVIITSYMIYGVGSFLCHYRFIHDLYSVSFCSKHAGDLSHYRWSPHNRSPRTMHGCYTWSRGDHLRHLASPHLVPPCHGRSPTAGPFTDWRGCFSS